MSGNAIDLGTIYSTIRIDLQKLQTDVRDATSYLGEIQTRVDELSAQVKETLSGAFSGLNGPAKTALGGVEADAASAAGAIAEVGAAGKAAGAAAAAGGEEAAAGLREAGLAAKEGGSGVKGFLGNVLGIGGAIGGVMLATQAFGFLKDRVAEAVQSGMEANQMTAQLVAGLRSTHDASGMTAQGLDDLSTHTMQLTGIDDDAVKSAESLLLTFTNIHRDVFPKATQAVADLATKMNGGAIPSTQQMQQAAVQLGKALGDPTKGYTALQRVGVTFTAQQVEQIKQMQAAGNVAGAQNVILAEMNKEFGGAAQAAGQANGGIAILRAEMANTVQTIGQALIPVINAATGALMPLAQWAGQIIPQAIKFLTDHADAVKIVLAGVALILGKALVPALAELIGPLFAADGAFSGLATVLGGIGFPVVAIAAALIGLGLAFKHVYDTSAPFKKAVDGLLEQLKGLAGIILGNLQDAFNRILPYLQQAATWVQDHLLAAIDATVPTLTRFAQWLARASDVIATNVAPVISSLTDKLIALFGWIQTTAIPAIQQFASGFGDHLGPVLQQVAGWVQTTLLPALQRFGQWIQSSALPAILQFAQGLAAQLGPQLQQAAQWVTGTLLPALQRLGQWIMGTALPAIKQFADGIGARLGPILQQLGGWLQTSVLPALKQFGGFLLTQVWPAVQQAAAALRQFADDLAVRLGPALKTIGGFISGFATILATVLKPIAIVVFGAIAIALIGLKNLWMAVWPGLQQVLFGVWEVIKGIIQTAWAIVSGIIKVGLDLLGGNWKQAWTDLKDMLGGVWEGIKTILTGAWDIIKGLFTSEGAVLGGIWSAIWTALQATIGAFFSGLGTWLHDKLAEIGQKLSDFGTALHADVTTLWDKITSTIEGKAAAIRDAILKPFNDAKGLIAGIVVGFADAAIRDLNLMIQGWADLGNDLGRVINTVAQAVGVGARVPALALPTIPLLASGTSHHAGGLAIVGEQGPELVHLPKGTSVLPAHQTAKVLSGVPGYAGGVGGFFSGLGTAVSGLTAEVASLLQTGPAALIALALASLNLGALTGAGGLLGSLGSGALTTLRGWAQEIVTTLLGHVAGASAATGGAGGMLAGLQHAGRAQPLVTLASGGVLREAVAGVGMSSGRSYLLGEAGQEAVVPLSRLGQRGGDVNIYGLTVEVVASSEDGAPYQAGVAFGNGFAAGFQQARTQRGI